MTPALAFQNQLSSSRQPKSAKANVTLDTRGIKGHRLLILAARRTHFFSFRSRRRIESPKAANSSIDMASALGEELTEEGELGGAAAVRKIAVAAFLGVLSVYLRNIRSP